jgi:predicted aspartyl protease
MRHGWRARRELVAGVAGLTLLTPLIAEADGAGSAGVRFRLTSERLIVVPVAVNGDGPHPFLLDTGATSTMLDERLARRLRLAATGGAAWESALGAEKSPLARATLGLGGVTAPDVEVLVTSLERMRAVAGPVDGVLGQDVLRRANWWLDYRRRTLVAGDGGETVAGARVPVRWEGDRPTVGVDVGRGAPLRLVLDSAASTAVLFRAPDPGWSRPAGSAHATTHSGDAAVPLVTISPATIGGVTIDGLTAAVMAPAARRDTDGLLPTSVFDRLYFDNATSTLVLDARPALTADGGAPTLDRWTSSSPRPASAPRAPSP